MDLNYASLIPTVLPSTCLYTEMLEINLDGFDLVIIVWRSPGCVLASGFSDWLTRGVTCYRVESQPVGSAVLE